MMEAQRYQAQGIDLHYYETKNQLQPLILLHAQGVDSTSFHSVWEALTKEYHVYAIDCYGHGESLHDPTQYHIVDIGNAIIRFMKDVVKENVILLGHSSGGLIATYIASHTDVCDYLVLEDPPFFSSQGERRKRSFNYIDLSTVCHEYLQQTECTDFVLYYFNHQYAWNFFPDSSREKIKRKLTKLAEHYRKKHPDRNLKVLFWPKAALSGFQGMNKYDPMFGETFYNDTFHSGIAHETLLRNIRCKTLFMKAQTNVSDDGILMAALSEDDLTKALELIEDCEVVRFDCGHGIHIEKQREFVDCLVKLKQE